MTIRPGTEWGEVVTCPSDVTVVLDDAALGRFLATATTGAVRVTGGDLVRTVGGVSHGPRCRRYELDVLRVVLDGDEEHARIAVAHVVVRAPGRGGWWRGPVWAAMNVSRLGSWDVAPRAHPNDGVVDLLTVDDDMSWRSRLQARRRLPTGTHVPHPAIHQRRAAAGEWRHDRPRAVYVDGALVGRARRVDVTVVADAVAVHV